MSDDFPNDITTTGLLTVNGSRITALFEDQDDADWFRFDVEPFQVYEFDTDDLRGRFFQSSLVANVYDEQGNLIEDLNNSNDRFVAPGSGHVFVETVAVESVTNYEIGVLVPEDDYTNFFSRSNEGEIVLFVDRQATIGGTIETPGDIDLFRYTFAEGSTNTITLHGANTSDATLETPILRLYRQTGTFQEPKFELIEADRFSGPGRSAQITYRPGNESETVIVMAAGTDDQTGTWSFEVETIDDFAPGREGRLQFTPNFHDTNKAVIGSIESNGDTDPFFISVKAGNWYNVLPTPDAIPILEITDPAGNLVNSPAPRSGRGDVIDNQGVFFAETSGEYQVTARAFEGVFGSGRLNLGVYRLSVDARAPFIEAVDEIGSGFRDALSWTSSYDLDRVQIFSEVHLQEVVGSSSTLRPPRQIIDVPFDTENSYRALNGLSGIEDLWIRGHEPITGEFTAWQKVQQTGELPLQFPREAELLHEGTFAFADALPAYWEGDTTISGFAPLTEAEKDAFRSALSAWNIVDTQNPGDTLTEIAPGVNNDAAEVMVFKSNISDAVMVLPNDWPQRNPSQKLVDFVINDSSPLFDDLSPGNQGFFELVRGVGKVIGLEDDPERSRTESVLGSRFGADVDGLPFPSTPLPRDLIGRRVFDDDINSGGSGDRYEIEFGNEEDNRYFLSLQTQTFSTIADADGFDWISASGSGLAATIDLQPLAPNFIGRGGNQWQTYLIDFDSDIENGVGDKFADTISGNRLDNLLIGNAGDDVLQGAPDWIDSTVASATINTFLKSATEQTSSTNRDLVAVTM